MPFKKQIADVEREIEETRASLSRVRAEAGTDAMLEHLLAVLAKQKAERIRLMERQRLTAPKTVE